MGAKTTSELHDDYLLLTGYGTIESISEYESLTEEYLNEAIKHHSLAAVIVNEVDIVFAPSLLLQLEVINFYDDNFPEIFKSIKVAVISNTDSFPFQYFWQHCANSAGYPYYKVFTSMAEAIAFVKS